VRPLCLTNGWVKVSETEERDEEDPALSSVVVAEAYLCSGIQMCLGVPTVKDIGVVILETQLRGLGCSLHNTSCSSLHKSEVGTFLMTGPLVKMNV